MGARISTVFETFAQALADVTVETAIKNKINDALAHNQIKAFEKLVLKILSDSTIDVEVRNMLKNTLELDIENHMDGNTVYEKMEFFKGGSPIALAGVVCLAALVLAMISKKDVPFSVSAFFIVSIFVCAAVLWTAQAALKNLVHLKDSLSVSTRIQRGEASLVKTKGRGKFCTDMIAAAGCGSKVGTAITQGVLTLEAYRCLSCVSEQCGKVLAALQGRLDQGCGFVGLAENKDAAQQKVREQMTEMRQSIQEISRDVSPKIDAVAKTAPFVTELADEVASLGKLLKRKEALLPYRPDYLLTETEKGKKQKHLADIEREVKNLCSWFRQNVADLEFQGNLDELQINTRCENMIRALAFAPAMLDAQRNAIQEAMDTRKKLNDKLLASIQKKNKAVSEMLDVKAQMNNLCDTYAQKLENLERLMVEQKKIVKGVGHGSINLVGYPPANDSQSKSIYKNWMEGRWDQLPETEYESGKFKFAINSKLTPAQEGAKKLLIKYVDDIDDLKVKHQEQIKKMETKHRELKESIPVFAENEAQDQKEMENARAALESNWATFATAHPVEYSQIKLLYSINNYVGKAAQWSCSASRPFSQIKSLMRQMNHSEECHPLELLPIVEALTVELNDNQTSWPSFLAQVGEWNLKKMLKPVNSSETEADRLIEDFSVTEQQAVTDVQVVD